MWSFFKVALVIRKIQERSLRAFPRIKEPQKTQAYSCCFRHDETLWDSLHTMCTMSIVVNWPLRKKCPYSELFWSAFFPHLPAFGLNSPGKMLTRIILNTDTFYAVIVSLSQYFTWKLLCWCQDFFIISSIIKILPWKFDARSSSVLFAFIFFPI